MYIVDQGIADLDAVDLVLKYGPGSRFQVMAPFEHMDMVGLDLGIAVESYLWPHLADTHEVFPMITEKVATGELGFKTDGVGFRTWTPEEQKAFRERCWTTWPGRRPRAPWDSRKAHPKTLELVFAKGLAILARMSLYFAIG